MCLTLRISSRKSCKVAVAATFEVDCERFVAGVAGVVVEEEDKSVMISASDCACNLFHNLSANFIVADFVRYLMSTVCLLAKASNERWWRIVTSRTRQANRWQMPRTKIRRT